MRSNVVRGLAHGAVAAALLVGAGGRAYGFADATQFFVNPAVPDGATLGANGEGLYFTGAPRFASRTCADCHVDGANQIGLQLGADPQSLFSDGYTPGMTYLLEVTLEHEHEGLQYTGSTCTDPPGTDSGYVQCNNNGFGLEIDAGGAPLTSGLCAAQPVNGVCPAPDPSSDEALVAPGGDAVFDNRPVDPNTAHLELRNGATSWRFYWTAPAAGSGPVTIYAGAVDGNGGAGTVDNDQDPYGDDTVSAQFFVQEAGAPAVINARAGCAAGGTPGRGSLALVAAALLVLVARRHRRARG